MAIPAITAAARVVGGVAARVLQRRILFNAMKDAFGGPSGPETGPGTAPTIQVGGVFGRMKGSGSFFSMATMMDNLNNEVLIGIKKSHEHTRGDGSTIPTWRLFGILEYGAPNNTLFGRPAPIPPRPAVTKLLRKRRKSINRRLARIVKQAAVQKMRKGQIKSEYERFAAQVVSEIKESIINSRERANTIAWQKVKGFNWPLVHDGDYVDSWTYQVIKRRPDSQTLRKAQEADRQLRKMRIGPNNVSGVNRFWSQLE